MEPLAVILVIVLGLVFGSFLNVCISRLPRHESIAHPRSRCPECGRAIAWYDNIPLVSFLLLRGRCRTCGKAISWRYPAIELSMAALWLLCWLKYGPTLQCLGAAVLSFLLLGLAAMDAETLRLPNAFTLPGIVLGIVYSGALCGRLHCALMSAAWAIAAGTVLAAIAGAYWVLRKRHGMGMGDAKLIAMVAAWLGPAEAILVLFLGAVAAAIYGLGMSLARRRLDGAAPLPFGSFLCAAALYAAFNGHRILAWYVGLFH